MRYAYEAGDRATVVSIKELSNDVLKMIFNLSPIFATIALDKGYITIHG